MDKENRKEEGAGRIDPDQSNKENNNTTDISFIDQQEGNMNNGTIGGNFDEKQQEQSLPTKKDE